MLLYLIIETLPSFRKAMVDSASKGNLTPEQIETLKVGMGKTNERWAKEKAEIRNAASVS